MRRLAPLAPGLLVGAVVALVCWNSCTPSGESVDPADAGTGAAGGLSAGSGGYGPGATGNTGAAPQLGGTGTGAQATTGGASSSAGAAGATIAWETFNTLGACEIQRAVNPDVAPPFFFWKPCGNESGCEVAKPDYEPWGSGSQYLTRGSSMLATASETELALRVGLGKASRLLLVSAVGNVRAAFREADPNVCLISITGISSTELGMLSSGTGPNGTSFYSTIRLDRASLNVVAAAEVTGFHPYAIAEFSPNLFSPDAWLAKQAGEDFWSLGRDGRAVQIIPQLPLSVVGRSAAHFMGDGRFAYSELRYVGTEMHDAVVISDWKSTRDLIASAGEDWGSARWTGDGVALLKGVDRVEGTYVLYDRTELWFGALPSDGSPFVPELVGIHAAGGDADGELGDGASGGNGYYIASLPPVSEQPGGQKRFRSFSIWNVRNKNRQDVHLEVGEEIAGILGMTQDHAYVLITDAHQPNYLKRFKLRAD